MSPLKKGLCVVCGTRTARRSAAEVEALNHSLYKIVREIRPATVRQIFYQAVVRGLVPKCETHGYRPVQHRLLALRKEGVVPFRWITDNARMVRGFPRYDGLAAYAKEVASRYRRDYWAESEVRVEVWIEKDALAGVLYPVVLREFGLDLYVTRGFSSHTYLQEAAEDINDDGRTTHVYLLTDLDPSGISIAENVEQNLRSMTMRDPNASSAAPSSPVVVKRLAVTRKQVEEYGLPTRPTKKTDARARKFAEEHGTDSVELDALPPDILRDMVRENIARHMDPYRLQAMKEQEERERKDLEGLAGTIGGAM